MSPSYQFVPAHLSIPPEVLARQPDIECVVGGPLHPQVVDVAQLLHGCVSDTPV